MEEIEIKILEVNKEKIVKNLLKLGATKIFDDEIQTLFLDFPDNRIHQSRNVLRLRKHGANAELTYKKVHADQTVKIADEFTVQISDIDITASILRNLGLSVTQKMEKHRTSYKIDEIQVDIDKYGSEFAFIPEFLEIEGPTPAISKYAKILGFQDKDCLPWSTDELIRHYATKKERDR